MKNETKKAVYKMILENILPTNTITLQKVYEIKVKIDKVKLVEKLVENNFIHTEDIIEFIKSDTNNYILENEIKMIDFDDDEFMFGFDDELPDDIYDGLRIYKKNNK